MKISKKQLGFSAVELVLIMVLIGIVGVVGYKVYDAQKAADKSYEQASSTPTNKQPASTSTSAVSPIKSTADLDSAEKTLDGVNPDEGSSDAAELDKDVSAF